MTWLCAQVKSFRRLCVHVVKNTIGLSRNEETCGKCRYSVMNVCLDCSHGLRAGRLHIALHRRRSRQLHCSLELRRFLFNAEVVGVELINSHHVVLGEQWGIRRFREFHELCFVVNIR